MNFSKRESVTVLVAFLMLSVTFYSFPQVDLAISSYFWQPDSGFYRADWPPFVWLYVVFAKTSAPLALGLILYWVSAQWLAPFLQLPASHMLRAYQKQVLFLLLVLLLGTLVVEVVLKLGWGRARPRDIVEFGGDLQFTAAWVFSDQCHSNCSFMSGHAAFGYYFMVLAWLKSSRLWLLPGFVLGVLLGVTRIAQGGHFTSDVVLPFFVVLAVAGIVSRWVLTSK